MAGFAPLSDGVVVVRPPVDGDADRLIAGRDGEFHRWLGPGADRPEPTACIVVAGEVVGWVDYEIGHPWLQPGEVNVGYNVFPSHRGQGYAARAVVLLLQHLAADTSYRAATLRIDPGNERSLAVAARCGFTAAGEMDGQRCFKRPIDRGPDQAAP